MIPTLLFCTGDAGAGKTTFIQERLLPDELFHNLRSATTRPPRKEYGEYEGNPYFFRDEDFFKNPKDFATYLFVNEQTWKPGDPKWLYGIPKSEVMDNLGKNLVYDVIQPRYVAQMIKWMDENKLKSEYNIKIAWFLPFKDGVDIIGKRANMPNDKIIREKNTCTAYDILDAGLEIDYTLCPRKNQYSQSLNNLISILYDDMMQKRPKLQPRTK